MKLSRRAAVVTGALASFLPKFAWTKAAGATILHREARWPVSAAFHEANTRPFPFLADLSRSDLRELQDNLLRKSEQSISEQLGGLTADEIKALPEDARRKVVQSSLTPREHALLRAANHHFDVRTGIDYLVGRPLSDFGFEHADQVHGNLWRPGCGCKLHRIFDHNRRFEDWGGRNERQLHPHYPHTLCDRHKPLAQRGLDELHFAVELHNTQSAGQV